MAEVLILKDGKREIIGRDRHFTDLLRERLGDDAADWFENLLSNIQDVIDETVNDLKAINDSSHTKVDILDALSDEIASLEKVVIST